MDNKCNYHDCIDEACWVCSCQEIQKYCDQHNKMHSLEKKCFSKCYDYQSINSKIKAYINAIKKVAQEYLKLSETIVKELQEITKRNLIIFKNMKTILKEYLLYDKDEPAEMILAWADNLMFLKRDKSQFTSSTQFLLGIENMTVEHFPKMEKLKVIFLN